MKKILTLLLLLIAGVSFSQHVRITQLKDVTVPGANLLQIVKPPSVPLYVRLNVDGSVSTLTASDFLTAIGGGSGGGDMYLANVQSVTGLKTFDKEKLAMLGTSTGKLIFSNALTDGTDYTQTFQARNGTVANLDNTFYLGTTSIALNRGSGALSLNGITSIDGNAATVTNGIYTTSQVTSLSAATDNKDKYLHSNASTGALEWSTVSGGGANTSLSNLSSVAINTTLVSDTDNTDALGTSAIGWSDLTLGNGAVVTFNSAPSTPDITLTHSTDKLTFGGGSFEIGNNSITANGNGYNQSAVNGNISINGASTFLTFGTFSNNTSANTAFYIKSRNGTIGNKTILQNNDVIKDDIYEGTDNSNYIRGARYQVLIDGTPSFGVMPMKHVWQTMNAAGVLADRMTLSAEGELTVTNTVIGTTIQANTGLIPDANDGAYLGTTTAQFSDLFLAEGAVINFDNGDATITQVGDVVTVAGADLKVTTPGTASTSVATIDGTQTLTNKTISLLTTTSSTNTNITYNDTEKRPYIGNGTAAVPVNNQTTQALTYNASITMNWLSGANATMTFGSGNTTITITNVPDGESGSIALTKDNTSTARTCTISGSTGYTTVIWKGGSSTLTATANAVDVVSYKRLGSKLFITLGLDFK